MTMLALNHLVARSIVDPGVVQAFESGRIADVIAELDFSPQMQADLSAIQAESWAEYAVLAYRAVRAAAEPVQRIELPSPAEGLIPDQAKAGQQRAA
jgi:hypothetical protein